MRTTKRASVGPATVVAPQLDGVVVGRVFIGSVLLAVLPFQLPEHPVRTCLDEIALPVDLWSDVGPRKHNTTTRGVS